VHSGIVTDDVRTLCDAGALSSEPVHRAGIAYGSGEFYRFLEHSDLIEFAPIPGTHGCAALTARERFTAVNSAVEVDLLGQANLEWQGGRLISGVGGAPDFVRAALRCPGGRSIIALASTTKGGTISRIVPKLHTPSVSIPRYDADTVVTEYGVAELRYLSDDDRAQALIAIAAPAHRPSLVEQWQMLQSTF
jgi:acyl-CoA hydrolase